MAETKGIVITLPKAIIVAVICTILGWGWNVERRMTTIEAGQDITLRVKSLEDALLPILVDWKVQNVLAEKLAKRDADDDPAPVMEDEIRKESEDWAKEQIQQSSMKGD